MADVSNAPVADSSASGASTLQALDISNDPELMDYNPQGGQLTAQHNAKWVHHRMEQIERASIRYQNVDDALLTIYQNLQKNLIELLTANHPHKKIHQDEQALRESIRIVHQELDTVKQLLKHKKDLTGHGVDAVHARILKNVIKDGKLHPLADRILLGMFNHAPAAIAGDDMSVLAGSMVTLHGSAIDADGDALSYAWSAPAGMTLVNASAANASFVAPATAGMYMFTLTVSDGFVSAQDTVMVTVIVPNTAPVADAGINQTVMAGSMVTLHGSGSDANGDTLSYMWTAPSGIVLSNANVANPSFTAPMAAGDYVLTLLVSDGKDVSVADSVMITVFVPNTAPVSEAGTNQTVGTGSKVTLHGSGSDADGDALSYMWTAPSGIMLSSSTVAEPTFTAPSAAGTYVFNLLVSDGKDVSMADSVTVTVINLNKAPVVNAGDDTGAMPGRFIYLEGNAYDPDGDPITVQWTALNGNIEIFDADSLNAYFISPSSSGTYRIVLTVSDGKLTTSDYINLQVY